MTRATGETRTIDPAARDAVDLGQLLTLENTGPWNFRAHRHDGNQNGRVFGGQLLGQALAAACQGVEGRQPTLLQLVFLHGARTDAAIDYTVTPLQDGRRFTTRHVRADQGAHSIVAATVSLQTAAEGYHHQAPMPAAIPPPHALRSIAELDADIAQRAHGKAYNLQNKPWLDLRLIDPEAFLFHPGKLARLQYWIKARCALGDSPLTHAAAVAYLSDYWLNYASLVPHVPVVGARDQIYVSSLNHSLWLHATLRADDWLLFDCESSRAEGSRGLTHARIYNLEGSLVASAAQENVVASRNG